jgi:protein-L-isoaspartate O-methyltransferase
MAGERRRESFDGAAADYGRYRTPYPGEVVADVLHCSDIGAGTRVLEIGCGTGQLSVPLARAGADLVTVELGANLARTARASRSPYPSARVEVSAFEGLAAPGQAVRRRCLRQRVPLARPARPVRQVRASAQARKTPRAKSAG